VGRFADGSPQSGQVEWIIVAGPDFAVALADLDKALSSIEAVVDPDRKRAEIVDLEQQVAAPDLWDNPDRAQRVTSRLSALQAEVDRVVGLRAQLEDLGVLVQLGQEEEDQASLTEAADVLASLQKAVEILEVRTLLSGEYDEREALVTIRSEAGGVDAADFAAGQNAIASRQRYMTPPTRRRRASSPPHFR
jgi:peptide chain release factor 2